MKNNSIARILMSAAPIMIVGCLLASGAPARAQSEDGGSHNGLQGAWRLQLTVRDCQTGAMLRTFPALATFAKGGTLTMTTAGQLPSLSTPPLGVWRRTGDHTYSAVSEAFVLAPPETGYRHTGSRGPSRSVTTRTVSPIQLRSKSWTPMAT
jgi:hypothetical protein